MTNILATHDSTDVTLIDTIVCPRCHAELNAGDERCLQCGGATKGSTPLLDRPWFLLSMLFLAALVLGLPFLWNSRAFQPRAKIVIAILVTLETILVFWGFTLVMMWCGRTIMDSMR